MTLQAFFYLQVSKNFDILEISLEAMSILESFTKIYIFNNNVAASLRVEEQISNKKLTTNITREK